MPGVQPGVEVGRHLQHVIIVTMEGAEHQLLVGIGNASDHPFPVCAVDGED